MDSDLTRALRDRGVRITPQRAFIWRALATTDDHLTAEALWKKTREFLPGLELSTIYRSLEALGEAGLVTESRFGDGPRVFEARSNPHPHLVCEDCGCISHLGDAGEDRLLHAFESEDTVNFQPRALHAFALGLCKDCTEKHGRQS